MGKKKDYDRGIIILWNSVKTFYNKFFFKCCCLKKSTCKKRAFFLYKKRGNNVANEKNLIPLNKRTPRERKEISRKGAIACNEKKRERKSMREDMEVLLSLPFKDKGYIEKLDELGFNTKNINNQNALLVSMYLKAYLLGDVQAFNAIRELIGEKVTEIKVNASIDDKVKQLDELLKK